MSRQRNSNVSQTALAVSSAEHTSTSQSRKRSILVVRDIERLDGRSLETKLTAESHVLDGQQRAVGDENHVQSAVADDDILGLVDDMGQNLVGGSVRVVILNKHIAATFAPISVKGGVDGLLDVRSVEVDLATLGEIVEAARESENIIQQRASRCDLVNIPARVDGKRSTLDVAEERPWPASWERLLRLGVDAWKRRRKVAGRGVVEVLFAERFVATLLISLVNLLDERIIEGHQVVVVVNEGNNNNIVLQVALS